MCVFLISPVPIAEPLTSELIDTPVFHILAPGPIKYRVSVPIPTCDSQQIRWAVGGDCSGPQSGEFQQAALEPNSAFQNVIILSAHQF